MSLWRRLRDGLRVLAKRQSADSAVDEEARHFLEEMTADFEARGMTAGEARRAAQMQMGSVVAVREQVRESGWEHALWSLWSDTRYALRRLSRSAGFSITAVVTLSLGIGATAAIFGVMESVLLRPLPYPESDRLVALVHRAPGINLEYLRMSPSLYFTYREEARVFEDLAIWNGGRATVTGMGEPEEARTLFVTHEFLRVLRVQPAMGRGFTPTDGAPGAARTVILSDEYGNRRFGSASSALGRHIVVDGNPHEIIGVLPADFEFLDEPVSLVIPRRLRREEEVLIAFSEDGIARLKPGVTLEQANADVARCLPLAPTKFPLNRGFAANAFADARIAPGLRTLKDQLIGDSGRTLWVLMGAVSLLLLIACANVANLLLVRADARQRELAVRVALGAGWMRIARELLLESVMLALGGGTVGLALCFIAIEVLKGSAFTSLPRLQSVSVDFWTLALTAGVALGCGILFGLIPVWRYARPAAAGVAARWATESRERRRTRTLLVASQVALATVLLVSSGLMLRTFQSLRRVDPGFTHPDQVQAVRVSIPSSLLSDSMLVFRTQEAVLRKFEALAGVTAVSITSSPPMEGTARNPLLVADHDYGEGNLPPVRSMRDVSPGFPASIGGRLIAGRDLSWTDLHSHARVCLISENLARELWSSPQAALGKRVRRNLREDWAEVVGVLGDIRDDGLQNAAPKMVYWPLLRSRHVDLLIRTPRAGSASFVQELRQALASVNANLPLANIRTLETYYRQSLARASFALTLLGIAGGMALLMGVVGIYGVIAYSVSRRRRDIGIRIALGASAKGVTQLFLREGFLVAGAGAGVGITAALVLTRWMHSLLHGVSAADPATYLLASAALIAAAIIASWLPARRAARIDPMETLRAE
ncbi:MAG: ABC transporter permease [Acidobacteria bacterium]|nr:ABC transporter permease [Acidobacteriota bacterium]